MNYPSRWLAPLLRFPIFGLAAPATTDWDALGQRWWSHVQYLADDRREGRDTGSRGHEQAAAYVAEQFRAAGLEPAGTSGFRQPIEFRVVRVDEPRCSLDLIHEGTTIPLRFGDDALLFLYPDSAETVEAEAVFAGYGLRVPEVGYDDFAGLDVRGKIVVAMGGGPADMPGPIKAHYQSPVERRRTLNAAGVVGFVRILNPKSIDLPWSRWATSRFEARMDLRDPGENLPTAIPLTVIYNTDSGPRLLQYSGHEFSEVLRAIEENRPLPHFPLRARIRARVAMSRSAVTSDNVVGVFPGSDPKLRHEYVAVSAHLDHIGIGAPINGDPVYSGAMDNASGCASLIEIARSLRDSHATPRRSILFLAVTGEEKGLLGSQYYAAHPTVRGPIVADVNMDMFNPLFALRYLEVQGLDESSLGDDIRAVAANAGVTVQPDHEPEHNLFIRSDQYSFIKKGVPALTFKFGYLPGSPEEQQFKEWLTVRYHAPLDDLDQPVDRAAAARFDAILQALILRVADADGRPEWRKDSFFRRFAKDS